MKSNALSTITSGQELISELFGGLEGENLAARAQNKKRILAAAQNYPVHSFERIALISSTEPQHERMRMLKAARSKGYLSSQQFQELTSIHLPHDLIETSKISNRKRVPTRYGAYIKSKHWQARKNLYWQTHPRRCAVCDSASHIQLHHIVYGHYGREPDEHLVALCAEHHAAFHRRYGVKCSMIKRTNKFITKQQALIASLNTNGN